MERKYQIKGLNHAQMKLFFEYINNAIPNSSLLIEKKLLLIDDSGKTKKECLTLIEQTCQAIKKNASVCEIDEYAKNKFILSYNPKIKFDYLTFINAMNYEDGIDEIAYDEKHLLLYVSYSPRIDILKLIERHLPKNVFVKVDTYNKKASFYVSKISKELLEYIKNLPEVSNASVDECKVIVSYHDRLDFNSYFINAIKEFDNTIRVYKYITEDEEETHLGYLRLVLGFATLVICTINHESIFGFTLLLVSIIIIGADVLYRAIKNFFKGILFDSDFLISIAVLGSIFTSHTYEAYLVLFIYQFSRFCGLIALTYSDHSVKKIGAKLPTKAIQIIDDKEELVYIEKLAKDDIIIVKPGEEIPLDGEVISGSTTVDTSLLTGNNNPKYINPKDMVLAGYKNISGIITIRVTQFFEETSLFKMFSNIKESKNQKTQILRFLEVFNSIYSPIVLIIAILMIIIPLIFGGSMDNGLYMALIFTVVSCPISINLAIPISYLTGIIVGSRRGIYIKGSDILEKLGKVDAVILSEDSLLSDDYEVVSIDTSLEEKEFFKIVSALSMHLSSPFFKSIIEYNKYPLDLSIIRETHSVNQAGVVGYYQDCEVKLGNKEFFDLYKIDVSSKENTMYLFLDKVLAGEIRFKRRYKEGAIKLAHNLLDLKNIKRVILFAQEDSEFIHSLGFSEIYVNQTLDEKNQLIESLNNQGMKTLVMGNLNNSISLMANGYLSATINEYNDMYSNIYILDDDICKIEDALRIGIAINKVNKSNLIISIIAKIILFALTLAHKTTIVYAILIDVGISILCILRVIFQVNRFRRRYK